MKRYEAAQLSASRREGVKHQRPKAEKPDSRDVKEQQIDHEWENFKQNMAAFAFEYEEKNGSWPEQRWFSQHTRNFQKVMDRTYPDRVRTDVPCKFWHRRMADQMTPVFLSVLDGVWDQFINEWANIHPYLGSPSAACECRSCR